MAAQRFTEADIRRWVERGLITSEQRDAMLRDLADRPPAEGGLNLTTLLYYSGGLLVLVAYSIFLGFQWEEMDSGGRVAISAASFAFFAVVSQFLLRTEGWRLPGELLQVAAVAIVPLLTFAVMDAAGIWPDDPGYYPGSGAEREQYQTDLTFARMVLAGATLAAAMAAFHLSRSPFVMAAGLIAVAALAIDVSLALQGQGDDYEWFTSQSILVAALGAAVFSAGVALRDRTERNYSLWLYILGVAGLTVGLGALAFTDYAAPGWGVAWMLAALAVVGLSIPLQERILAAAGLAGVFAYLARLVFDVFESANAALALVALGLLIVGAGMLYQRYADRIFRRQETG